MIARIEQAFDSLFQELADAKWAERATTKGGYRLRGFLTLLAIFGILAVLAVGWMLLSPYYLVKWWRSPRKENDERCS